MSEEDRYRCSFCGVVQTRAKRLIAGPAGVLICAGCVHLCQEIFVNQGYLEPVRGPGEVCSFCGQPFDQWENGSFTGLHNEKICFPCVHLYGHEKDRLLREILLPDEEPASEEAAT